MDTDLLEEGKRNMRERLEREGYFDANVSYTVVSKDVVGTKAGWKDSEETITYTIVRGTGTSSSNRLQRNHYFGTSTLKSRLTICKFVGNTAKIQPPIDGIRRVVDEESLYLERISFGHGGCAGDGRLKGEDGSVIRL